MMGPPPMARYVNGRLIAPSPEKTVTTVIVWPRLHAFAADRWLNADSVRSAKFWRRVMDWCVEESVSWRWVFVE